ncbi:MAG: hypothetical protein IPK66_18500 [Rhodospirillales bacterium]|nr:hypothetical protein [Rhodospirillales bacterium]
MFFKNPNDEEKAKRKTRLEQLNLFAPFTPLLKFKRLTEKHESNRMDKIFIKKLESLNDEIRQGRETERLSKAIGEIKKHFGSSRNLIPWAASKGIEI